MPPIKPLGTYGQANRDLVDLIKSGIVRQRKKRADLMKRAGKCERTYYARLDNPAAITVAELRVLRRELKITDEELLSVL